jgi:hypothetical protein
MARRSPAPMKAQGFCLATTSTAAEPAPGKQRNVGELQSLRCASAGSCMAKGGSLYWTVLPLRRDCAASERRVPSRGVRQRSLRLSLGHVLRHQCRSGMIRLACREQGVWVLGAANPFRGTDGEMRIGETTFCGATQLSCTTKSWQSCWCVQLRDYAQELGNDEPMAGVMRPCVDARSARLDRRWPATLGEWNPRRGVAHFHQAGEFVVGRIALRGA